ncbi:hypothetical protein RRG08_027550 [Elysia crispata]|uniref:Uncharacterized protein n=1 Tax=Elysia crispata TaxID=231223 RepID=A0AAE1EE23_9GAST|nr:hypothetical protein RRG08_027550 [Elysia crispata]
MVKSFIFSVRSTYMVSSTRIFQLALIHVEWLKIEIGNPVAWQTKHSGALLYFKADEVGKQVEQEQRGELSYRCGDRGDSD